MSVKHIVDNILQKIDQSDKETNFSSLADKGQVVQLKDGVAVITGLKNALYNEVIYFETGVRGLVLDLLQHSVQALILGDSQKVYPGCSVSGSGKVFSVHVGRELLGRVVNGAGEALDDRPDILTDELYPVEKIAPRVIERKSVDQPLQTGIMAIDAMVPIGKGQRELLIGDRQTGKTAVAIDTILAQKGQNVFCIYVAIGQKDAKVARVVSTLRQQGALDYTIIVNASSASPAVMQYLAPYVGCAYGEWFMNNGMDALIVYDDLSKHAVAYREMSLLMKRPPGREAFPGDVFYLHSRLLERAARLDVAYGGGSLTALPIVETQAGDISAYIPTNVISITDGQIFLESRLFNAGVRPAINVGLSVSRVGGAAQTKIVKKISGGLKLDLATYRELQSFAQFGSDLDPVTKAKLDKGERLVEILKQAENKPIDIAVQSVLMYAGTRDYLKSVPVNRVLDFVAAVNDAMLGSQAKDLHAMILDQKALTDDIENSIKTLINDILVQLV